jgi:hypothetical protein
MKENEDVLVDEELTENDFEDEEEVSETDQVEETETESKKTQTKEERSFYAKLRRRNDELEKENKKLLKEKGEADFSARKKVVSADTLADLGLDKIEDENDLLLCEEYDKAVKRGSENPVLDATKALRLKVKDDKVKLDKSEEERVSREKLVNEDMKNFQKEFGITTAEALKDERFVKAFGKKIDFGNMTELYGIYKSLVSEEENKDDNVSKKMGKIPSSSNSQSKKVNINDLDGEDFLKAFNEKYHL